MFTTKAFSPLMDNILFKHPLLKAQPQQSPERIDNFISNNIRNYSRSSVKKLCLESRILVNDLPVKASYMVKPDDELSILLPYSTFGEKPRAVDLQLKVLFEDENIIVIDKPPGMAVHPGLGDYNNSALNGLLHHLKNDEDSNVFIVHRIDKHTSGVVVMAKNQAALEFLQKQFLSHSMERIYHCLVWGIVKQDSGKIESYIGRNPLNERSIEVSADRSFGKKAITNFRVLERLRGITLVECRLETGRTHQIRIHMQSIGHALVGDQRYPAAALPGSATDEEITELMPHQALHAGVLGFISPTDGSHKRFEVPYPERFQQLLEYLHKRLD